MKIILKKLSKTFKN